MDIRVLLGQMLVLFTMMVVGYCVCRKKWIDQDMDAGMSRLIVNVFNPALVLGSVAGGRGNISGEAIRVNIVLVFVYFGLLILVSFPMVWILRPRGQDRVIYRMMTIFSNLGFMGIPLVRSIYGQEALLYVAFYILGYNLLVYTYGIYLAQKAGKRAGGGFGRGLWNPGVAAGLGAILIFAMDLRLPLPVVSFCEYMGGATIPLSMMLIGVSIARADIGKQWRDGRVWLFVLLRMVVFPVLMIGAGRGLDVDKVVFGVFVIECCMPVGSIVTMIIKNSGAREEVCVRGTLISTLASVVTIPLVCSLL